MKSLSRITTLFLSSLLLPSTTTTTTALGPPRPYYPPINYQQRNLATITKIYNQTVYPNSLAFAANGSASVPAGLFAESATGRITPVGNFSGFQDSVEYFFALAPYGQPPLYQIFGAANVVAFTSGCAEVATSVVYFDQVVRNPGATDNGRLVSRLKQIAFWRFDATGAVVAYDAWIPNLQAYANFVAIGGSPYATSYPALVQNYLISSLCQAAQQNCVGANQQYASQAVCEAVLKTKNYGDYDEAWGDNVVCRTIHILLTKVRPEVHCPHVGPTGGGKCVDVVYNTQYFDDAALFGASEAQTFMCPS